MPATIHLIRHGEGYHNVSDENKGIRDPKLTKKGEDQCRHACETFPHHDKLVRLYASPLTRTLQTCILAFRTPEFVKAHKHAAVIALPCYQEVSTLPYDTGMQPVEIKELFNGSVDLTHVPEDWFKKNTKGKSWKEQEEQLFERGRNARARIHKSLQNLPEDAHIGVAAHGTFLHFATNDFDGLEPGMTTAWANAEWRSYQFADETGPEGAPILVETEESWRRRHDTNERPSTKENLKQRDNLLKKMKNDYHDEK